LESIEEFSKKLAGVDDGVLWQWGRIGELIGKSRSPKVSAAEIKTREHVVGTGSVWRGVEGKDGVGGGEAFLFDSQNFRITRGNEVFPATDDQTYWTFQAADFKGAQQIDLRGTIISDRENLSEILKKISGGKPLVATFDVEFSEDFFSRSNGLFAEDRVADREKRLFESNETKGGHLVGGSTNEGDRKSLHEKFSAEEAAKVDFAFTIKSNVLLKPIDRLLIAKKDGSFREPRTEIEVTKAATVIQKKWRKIHS
jgi:hypothetical protein